MTSISEKKINKTNNQFGFVLLFFLLFSIATSAKADVVKEIIKEYKLDPKNNPKHQCELMFFLDIILHNEEDSEPPEVGLQEIKKRIGVKKFKWEPMTDNTYSLNNEIIVKDFIAYVGGNFSDIIRLYSDKYGNQIGYFSMLLSDFGVSEDEYKKDTHWARRTKKAVGDSYAKSSDEMVDFVDAKHPKIMFITNGCRIKFLKNK